MKAPLVATLICLCGAANAATCDTPSHPAQSLALPPGGGLILMAGAQAGPDTPREGRVPHKEGNLLLAGLALMAAIALRRAGALQ